MIIAESFSFFGVIALYSYSFATKVFPAETPTDFLTPRALGLFSP
jgi:hypothetical protein